MNIDLVIASIMISGAYINNHGDQIIRTEKPLAIDDTFTLIVQKTPHLQTRYSYASFRVAKADAEAYRRIHNGGRVVWTCNKQCMDNILSGKARKK